jgi:hypothetical protein
LFCPSFLIRAFLQLKEHGNNISIINTALKTPGSRVRFAYKATTAGHGDLTTSGEVTQNRTVEPVGWLPHCESRIFVASDKKKYRISGLIGNLELLEPEIQEDKSAEEDECSGD